jgi:hypothetical protein
MSLERERTHRLAAVYEALCQLVQSEIAEFWHPDLVVKPTARGLRDLADCLDALIVNVFLRELPDENAWYHVSADDAPFLGEVEVALINERLSRWEERRMTARAMGQPAAAIVPAGSSTAHFTWPPTVWTHYVHEVAVPPISRVTE